MTSRVRFAPSPTGQLHVGGARTALFNWLFSRGTAGKMVLRIEDTDQVRSSRESEESIKTDLRWLGLQWDEGPDEGGPGAPYRQSERRDLYDAAFQQLLDAGHAYLAYESPAELGAMRDAARAEKRDFIFRKPAYSAEDLARFEADGRTPVVRLEAPGHDATFVDQVLGEITVPEAKLDDFVIRKADGFPTYHLAVVVDDHHMQVTNVLRAQEHLMNTAKHLLLYEALGWEPPQHGHMPLIFSMDGSKMSKRDKAKATRARVRELGWDDAQVAEATGLDESTTQAQQAPRLPNEDTVGPADHSAAIVGCVRLPLSVQEEEYPPAVIHQRNVVCNNDAFQVSDAESATNRESITVLRHSLKPAVSPT